VALIATDAKTMPKGLCGMKVALCGKCSDLDVAGRKSRREG